MCKRYILFSFLVLAIAAQSQAQQATAKKWQFHSINQLGLLEGEAGSAFQVQTVNGFQRGSWFGGIGLGIDNYRFRTIPLFADIRKEFGKSANRFFIYGDGGIHFAWLTDNQKSKIVMAGDPVSNGFYLDAGAGYKIRMGAKSALLLNLGYSYKYLSEQAPPQLYFVPAIYIMNTPTSGDTYNYHLNRISLKVGWEF